MMVDETTVFHGGCENITKQMIMLEEPYIRPQSVINIVEITDATRANPQPDNETEKSLGEFISAQKLKEIGGVSHLFDLKELTVKVDTSETSIGNVGTMAPNLKKLNLNNSFITSVRDLGTSLNNLNTLWLSRCCLAELDGISCIGTLKELFVAYNEIFDLSPLSMLENIEVLDLEGNNVDDITEVEFLTLCTKLRILTIKGNPLEYSPTPTTDAKDLMFYSYRDAVLSCLPQLTMLDDDKFLEELIDGKKVKRDNPKVTQREEYLKDDFKILCNNLKAMETDLAEESDNSEGTSTARPMSARIRTQTAKTIQTNNVEKSSQLRLNKNDIPEESLFELRDCSTLTHGKVLCGNPVQALRNRNTLHIAQPETIIPKNIKMKTATIFKPEHSYLTAEEDSMNKDDVFDQLRAWRLQNKSLFEGSVDLSITSVNRDNRTVSNPTYSPVSNPAHTPNIHPSYSPSPPTKPKSSQTSSRSRRSFVPVDDDRPSTAADFRRTVVVTEPDMVIVTLDVINEHNITNCNKTPKSRTKKDDRLIRPSTARAALQTSPKVVDNLQDDT